MNFKKRASGSWVDAPHYIHGTDTDTITTLPATLYPNDTSITVGIKGQSSQSGTPSPSNPVDVDGVGELETSGQYSGQYKIPISMGGTTNNVYLGEVQTERKIKKVVFTGSADEAWNRAGSTHGYFIGLPNEARTAGATVIISSHYVAAMGGADGTIRIGNSKTEVLIYDNYTSATDFKAYLQQQYANGTPVTVWYVLATPQTAVVNEPLMKIGDYADSLTTSVSCTAGENSFDISTTVQPSEVAATFEGWHAVSAAHERDNGQWD